MYIILLLSYVSFIGLGLWAAMMGFGIIKAKTPEKRAKIEKNNILLIIGGIILILWNLSEILDFFK